MTRTFESGRLAGLATLLLGCLPMIALAFNFGVA